MILWYAIGYVVLVAKTSNGEECILIQGGENGKAPLSRPGRVPAVLDGWPESCIITALTTYEIDLCGTGTS